MCQDHAGPGWPTWRRTSFRIRKARLLCSWWSIPVTRSPLDADFPPPASSWPSAFFIHGWHCLLLDLDIRRRYLRTRHRSGISAIVIRVSRQCEVLERPGLSDHADLGVNCGSTVWLQGVGQFTELLRTSASFSLSRNLQSALWGLWVTLM